MATVKVFTMSDILCRHNLHRRKTPKCWKCGKPIKIGERVVLKATRKWRLYHKECWDGMFY